MTEGLSRSLLINTLWSFFGRFGYLAVGLIGNIILVRLLSPKEFGQVGIMMFFIIVANVLVESGLSGALIRKQKVTEIDYSTIFIFNLMISLFLMSVLIASSSYIAEFYNDPELKKILFASSFVLFFNALIITQNTKLIKNLQFKSKAIFECVSIFAGSIIAIFLAFKGAGVWALIALQLSTAIILACILWIFVEPTKIFKFSISSFKEFYKFGINTTLASLLNTAFDNIYQLILGKYFAISQAGYYYQAKKLQEMPIGVLQTTMLGVVYSTLTRLQDDSVKFNDLYQNLVRIFTIVVALITMVIFYYSDLIVNLLYGDKWTSSIMYLQLLSIASFFYLQEMFNRIIFKIFDKTEKILQLEVFKKIIQSITILYGLWIMSINVLIYGFVLTSIISFMVNYYYARVIQNYFNYKEFLDIIKIIVICIFIILICIFIADKFSIVGLRNLLLFPLMLGMYAIFLHCFKIINLKKDFHNFLNILSRGK